jgi:hypothetical protein
MAKRAKQTNEITATDPNPHDAATHSEPPMMADGHPATETITNGDAAQQAKPDDKAWPAAPEPFGIQSIALSPENDGPRMRLLRSNKYQQIQIQFDDKPDEAVRARLNAEGWKWRSVEKVWTKQLDPDARWRTHADAERLFKELGDAIRVERGLAPTWEAAR